MPRYVAIVALLFVLVAAGCRQAQPTSPASQSVQVAVTAEPNPPVTGKAQLVVTLKDAGGAPVSDATLSVRADMTHAGMAPVIREGITGQNGVYTIPFEWTMAGDWVVEVTAKLKDGTSSAQTFKYSVGESGSGMSMNMNMGGTAQATAEATAASMTMEMGATAAATAEATSSMMDMNMTMPTANRGGG